MSERVIVKRLINGTVVPDRVIECERASISMSAEIGDSTAAIDFAGCKPDADGWQLVYMAVTNVVQVERQRRVVPDNKETESPQSGS